MCCKMLDFDLSDIFSHLNEVFEGHSCSVCSHTHTHTATHSLQHKLASNKYLYVCHEILECKRTSCQAFQHYIVR